MKYHYFRTDLVGGPWNSISLSKIFNKSSQQLVIAYNDHLDIYNWNQGPGEWTTSKCTDITFMDRLAVFADLRHIQRYSNKKFELDHLLLLTKQSLSLVIYDTDKNSFICKFTMYLTSDDANFTWIDQEDVIWIVGNLTLTRLEVVKSEPIEILQTGCFRMNYRDVPKFCFRTKSGNYALDFVLIFEHINRKVNLWLLKFNHKGYHKKILLNYAVKDPREFLGSSRKFNLIFLLTEDSIYALDFNLNVTNSLKLPQKYSQINLIEGDFPQWVVYFDGRCMLFEVVLKKDKMAYILESYHMNPFSPRFDPSTITIIKSGIYLLQPGHIVTPSKLEDQVNLVFLSSLNPLLRWKIGVPSAPSIFQKKIIFPVVQTDNIIIKTAQRGMKVKHDFCTQLKGVNSLYSFAIRTQNFNYPVLALSHLNKTQFLILKDRNTSNHRTIQNSRLTYNNFKKKHTFFKQFLIRELKLKNSISTDRTLHLSSFKTNLLLQVTPNEARIYSMNSDEWLSHMPPKNQLFEIAVRNEDILILSTTGLELSVIELKKCNFNKVSKVFLDVKCNFISSKHSICILSFWNKSILRFYQLPYLLELGYISIELEFGVQIKETLLTTMSHSSYIFIALSNDELLVKQIDLSKLIEIGSNKSSNLSLPRYLGGLIKGTIKSQHTNLSLKEIEQFPYIIKDTKANSEVLIGSSYYNQVDIAEERQFNNNNEQYNVIFLAGMEPTIIQANDTGELILRRININKIRLITHIHPLESFPNLFSWINDQNLFIGGINTADSFDSYSVYMNTRNMNVLEATHDSYSNFLILLAEFEDLHITPLDAIKNNLLYLQLLFYDIQDFNLHHKIEFDIFKRDYADITTQIIHCNEDHHSLVIPSFCSILKGEQFHNNGLTEDTLYFFQLKNKNSKEKGAPTILPTDISSKGKISACSSDKNIFISKDTELLCLQLIYKNENRPLEVKEVAKYILGITITTLYSENSIVYLLLFDWSLVILNFNLDKFEELKTISMPHSYDQIAFIDSTELLALNDMNITPVDLSNPPANNTFIGANTPYIFNHFQGRLKLFDCSDILNIYNDGKLFNLQLIKGFLWTSERGSFGELIILESKSESSYHFIGLLQKAIVISMSTFGDYSYHKWRYHSSSMPKLLDIDPSVLSKESEFIDGNLLEMFLNSSHSFKQQTFVETQRLASQNAVELPSLEEIVLKLSLFVQYTFANETLDQLT